MNLHEIIRDADKAGSLLNNPAWESIFLRVKKHLFELWCEETNPNAREEIWYTMHALNTLDHGLNQIVSDGQFARQELGDKQ